MNFYVCTNSYLCVAPNIYDKNLDPDATDPDRFWFERLIYTEAIEDIYCSIAEKLDKVFGGYVYGHQIKSLLVKRRL